MAVFQKFEQLDDKTFFVDLVADHYVNGWQRVSKAAGSKVEIDDTLIPLAYDRYQINLQQYIKVLKSKNPDQFKRAGALLHALYTAPPITGVSWSAATMRLRDPAAVGTSQGDVDYWDKYCAWFKEYCNHLMAFDLAFRCCQVYEPVIRTYDQDYLDNMCYYMAENTNINVGSFVMIFKSYMADGVKS